jgi:hypothetical protein
MGLPNVSILTFPLCTFDDARARSLIFIQIALALSVLAHITGIIQGATTYHAASTSKYTVTFRTIPSPNTADAIHFQLCKRQR